MHELSLAANMLEQIAPLVKNKTELKKVHVTIGPLAGVHAESLEFGFTELAKADGYTDVALIIHKKSASLRCDECKEIYETDHFDNGCPLCGGIQRTIISGREFTLDSIEVEEDDV